MFFISNVCTSDCRPNVFKVKKIYWAKVLPEQLDLSQIFRKHEIFRIVLRIIFKQTIIHLSKLLNFIMSSTSKLTRHICLGLSVHYACTRSALGQEPLEIGS